MQMVSIMAPEEAQGACKELCVCCMKEEGSCVVGYTGVTRDIVLVLGVGRPMFCEEPLQVVCLHGSWYRSLPSAMTWARVGISCILVCPRKGMEDVKVRLYHYY